MTTTVEAYPGRAEISMNDAWIQGRPTEVSFQWGNAEICNFDDWFCRWPDGLTTTVLSVSCQGCAVLDDPTGTTMFTETMRKLTAVATTDGSISVSVALRFDATGDEKTVTATAVGDHEVALEADCRLIDVSDLYYGATAPGAILPGDTAWQTCGATRLANQAVVVFPAIRTYRNQRYFPFCFPGWGCATGWNEALRPLAQLSLTPAPAGWGQVGHRPGATGDELVFFAAYPGAPAGTVALAAPLLSGAVATVSLAIPGPP